MKKVFGKFDTRSNKDSRFVSMDGGGIFPHSPTQEKGGGYSPPPSRCILYIVVYEKLDKMKRNVFSKQS